MQIIFPMAGNGSRFLDAGFSKPKPLIEVHNKPMIEHIINLFDKDDNFLFIINKEHEQKHNMKKRLENLKPGAKIFSIAYQKLGPVWGTLEAADKIDEEEPTIVVYCDVNASLNYSEFKKEVEQNSVDGVLICFTGFQPHFYGSNMFAGVKTDKNNVVKEVREKYSFTKDKSKGLHSNGMYYFKNGGLIKKYFKTLMDRNLCHNNGEYYVSQVYNPMIEDGLKVVVHKTDHFCDWGTPESLNEYTFWQSFIESSEPINLREKISEIKERLPYVPKSDYKKVLAYWNSFNRFKLKI